MRQFKTQREGGFKDSERPRFIIPDDLGNRHRQEMQTLLDAGEAELLPADPAPTPLTDKQRVIEEITASRALTALIHWLAEDKGIVKKVLINQIQAKL